MCGVLFSWPYNARGQNTPIAGLNAGTNEAPGFREVLARRDCETGRAAAARAFDKQQLLAADKSRKPGRKCVLAFRAQAPSALLDEAAGQLRHARSRCSLP